MKIVQYIEKYYKLRNFIFLLIVIFSIASCEKDITVDLPRPEKAVVIEGAIESGAYPWVIITRNTPYFEPVDAQTVVNLLVLNAYVIVTDGHDTDKLTLQVDTNLVPPFIYKGSHIKGEVGKTYFLKAIVDGKEYTSYTTIPNPVTLDSVKFKPRNPQENDTLGYLWIYFRDPDSIGNNYRIFSKTLGKDSVFVHPFSSVADDMLINGRNVEYLVYRGRNPNIMTDPNAAPDPTKPPRWAFVTGETAVIKFCSIDKTHFNFWKSVEQQMSSDGNPFASPTSVVTNIEGGALGIWGGYGVFLDTIKINKAK